MINPGLTASQLQAAIALVAAGCDLGVSIRLMDHDHNSLMTLTDKFDDGQVNIDVTQETTRTAQMTFLDPEHDIPLDRENPLAGEMYYTKMIRAYYVMRAYDAPGEETIAVPVFTGPVRKVFREGEKLQVE